MRSKSSSGSDGTGASAETPLNDRNVGSTASVRHRHSLRLLNAVNVLILQVIGHFLNMRHHMQLPSTYTASIFIRKYKSYNSM